MIINILKPCTVLGKRVSQGEFDIDDNVAKVLIDGGFAEAVKKATKKKADDDRD